MPCIRPKIEAVIERLKRYKPIMNQPTPITCPQCHHQNNSNASHCELCEWPLVNEHLEATELATATIDPCATIDPNATTLENLDPNVTVAPENFEPTPTTASESNTFSFAGDLSHFEVLEVLGQGGMGMVYHAKDLTLQRDVALKMLRPLKSSQQIHTETLLDEARMASQLNHPNIVTIYDVARAENSNYIVMEWVDGQPLDELIPEDGLPLVTAIDYARQIAHGLAAAHQKFIIHRDIKPQNIMLSEQGALKILDFGISGLVEQMSAQDRENSVGLQTTPAAGTPSYMSPEQAKGLNLDPRTDIFSLGIVLYQMLAGKRPFNGKNAKEMKQAICTGQFTPIEHHKTDLSEDVITTVNKMLAISKDQRWQSTSELADKPDAIYHELTYTKNWWQKRHWLTKAAMLLPFMVALAWTTKDILFPASTQELIEQQLAEATKVAILPFENISGDPQIQLFSDGLAVNLGSDLSAIANEQGNTWIVPSTEISRMNDPTPKSVTDKYGVNLILTGSMQHMGSTRLMVLNLLDATNGQLMKTTELEIDAEKLFEGHSLIREEALNLLNWSTPESVQSRFQAQRPQLDGAYREYIKGIGYFYRFDQPNALAKAEESFKKAIKLSPDYALAYIGLAESQLMNFRQTKDSQWLDYMEQTITSLANISSDRCQVDYLRAELLTRKGEYPKAIELFSSCLDESPKHIPSYLGLANAHAKSGDNESAAYHYQKTIEISPNNVKSIIDFGIFFYNSGQYEKAIEQSKILAQMAPNNVNAYLYLAGNNYAIGNIDEAIKYTKQALEIKPSSSGYSNLATMQFYKKNYDESVIGFEKAVDLNPSHYIIWGNLADSYKLTNNSKAKETYLKAVELTRKALSTNPKDASLKANLAYYLANSDQKEEAVSFARQITSQHSGWENFLVAQAYDHLGMITEALIHVEYALNKNYSIDEIKITPLLEKTRKNKEFETLINSK